VLKTKSQKGKDWRAAQPRVDTLDGSCGGAEPRLTSGGRADLKDGQESKKVFVTQIAPEQGNLGLLRIERYYL
jgi:hypothetical protein